MAMIFEYITIEGFGSYITRKKFWLNNKGVTAIIGSVGAGKSSMFAALYWCIYGKPLKANKQIETYEWSRPKDYQGTKTELVIKKGEDSYIITRCQNYKGQVYGSAGKNRLIIAKNGVPLNNLRNKDDVKRYLIKLIGMGPELFKNSLLFGQKLQRFISQDGPTKKQILDEAFESSFIQDARDYIDGQIKHYKEARVSTINDYTILNLKLEQIDKDRLLAKQITESYEKDRAENIKVLKSKLKKRKVQIEELIVFENPKELEVQLAKLQERLKNTQREIKRRDQISKDEFLQKNKVDLLEHEMEKAKAEIRGSKLAILKPDKICVRCKNPLTPEQIQRQKKGFKEGIKKHGENLTLIKADLIESQGIYKNITDALSMLSNFQEGPIYQEISEVKVKLSKSKGTKEYLQKLKIEIQELKASIENQKKYQPTIPIIDEKQAKSLKKEVELKEQELKSIERKLSNFQWCLKDPLSNSGIKAHIFDSMLSLINRELSKYQKSLGFKIEVLVDMDSTKKDVECILTKKSNFINTADLSGGQEQLVDLAIAFALNEVVTKGKGISLLMLDEAFESIGGKELEEMFAFIKTIAHNKSVYLITHRPDFAMSVKRVIRAELGEDGDTIFT